MICVGEITITAKWKRRQTGHNGSEGWRADSPKELLLQ